MSDKLYSKYWWISCKDRRSEIERLSRDTPLPDENIKYIIRELNE